MAHFFGSMKGARGEATRCGTKSSGISGHLRGWGAGVLIEGGTTPEGKDYFKIFATSGSGDNGPTKLIATVTDTGEHVAVTVSKGAENNGGN